MSPLAHLLFAAAALYAASAAAAPIIPAKPLAPAVLDSKLVPEIVPEAPVQNNKPLDKEDAPALIVNKVENNLRAKPEDIPVQVVIEEVKAAIKTNEVSDVEEKERFQIDLKNPGQPQRQEHETQNSDQFSDAQQKLTAVQESIAQTQHLLTQGVKGLGDDISNWLSTNEQVSVIEKHIQSLRESFTAQIQKLTETVQNVATPQPLKSEENSEQAPIKPDLKKIEASLSNLKSKFDNGVRALSEGVNIVALLRAEDESANPAASQPAPSPDGQNVLSQFFSSFQHSLSDAFENFRNTTNNFLNRPTSNPPSNVQADTPDGSNSGTQFQGPLSFLNYFNLNQNQGGAGQSPPSPSQGIFGPFSNFTLGLPNVFGWQTPAKPAEGSNGVPLSPTKATPVAPSPDAIVADPAAPAPAPAAAVPAPQAVGPIRQIVQRIQSSINNPEKPRDTEKPDDLQTKGGLYYGGHRPGGGSGDSDGLNSSGVKSQPEEPIKEIKEEIKKQEDKEIIPKVVLEKSE